MQYSGQILDGQMHGKGRLVYENGEIYAGDWLRGKRHGRGEYTYNDGTKFEGVWENVQTIIVRLWCKNMKLNIILFAGQNQWRRHVLVPKRKHLFGRLE